VTITLAQLRADIRLNQPDITAWPDATIDGWIRQAIRFYSAHYPRRWRHTLSLSTGTQSYDLPGEHGFAGIVSVEYPAGETPPRYLSQAAEWWAGFQIGYNVYALRGVADDAAPDNAAGQIVFAEAVATGQQAIIEYLGDHQPPAADNDLITVPPGHLEAITAYVRFAGLAEFEIDEATTITDSALILSQLGQEARLAWNRYKEIMDRLSWLGNDPLPVPPPNWQEIGL
jgi:hypothetical protein